MFAISRVIIALISATVFMFPILINGAGIVIQLSVAERARTYFRPQTVLTDYRKILDENEDALLSGAAYPDAYYNELCDFGSFANISDDTKTGPFLSASINYINKLPKPWNKTTEKLVAFMMGVMSNQISDSLWTGRGVDQGFLPTMGNINLHGSITEARNAGNFGGDVAVLYQLNGPYDELINGWYVPVDDLYEIYKEFYGSAMINQSIIESCSTLSLVTAYAEILGSAEFYTVVADTSVFMVDNVLEYFQGGMNDMVGWTNIKWHDAITMLENGSGACFIPKNPLLINCTKMQQRDDNFRNKHISQNYPVRQIVGDTTIGDMEITQVHRGVTIKPGKNLQKRLQDYKQFLTVSKKKLKKRNPRTDIPYKIMYGVYRHYSLLGLSLYTKDLDGDGNQDAVIGAPEYGEDESPQEGRVFVLYSTDNGLPLPNKYVVVNFIDLNNASLPYNRIFSGQNKTQSKFGSSMAVLDVNLDGMMDLAVGASSFGNTNHLDYNGRVYVYFGTGKARKWNTDADIVLTCSLKYCNLGYSLTVLDTNGDGHDDLVIGSPYASTDNKTQNGIVTSLPSQSTYKGPGMIIPIETLTVKLTGNQDYSWFGHNMIAKNGVLLVSQPHFRVCINPTCPTFTETDKQSVGRLNIYNFGRTVSLPNTSIAGLDAFELAGYSSDLGYPFGNKTLVMAIGVPGADVDGEILTVPTKLTQAGQVILMKFVDGRFEQIAVYDSDRRYSRFGSMVKFQDLNHDGIDDLIIGSPFRNDDPSNLVNIAYNGKAYIFNGGQNFRVGNVTKKGCEEISPCPDHNANATLDDGYDDKTDFANNFATLRAKNKTQFLVSASVSSISMGALFADAGKVYVFNFDKH